MRSLIKALILIVILFFSGVVLSQPGGGGGGGPGGGQGNDPCDNPNPPPSCANVPIDDYVHYLLLGGIFLGLYFVKNSSQRNKEEPSAN